MFHLVFQIFEPHQQLCVLPNNPEDCNANSSCFPPLDQDNQDSSDFNKNPEDSCKNCSEAPLNNPQISETDQTIYHLISNYKIDIPTTNIDRNSYLSLLNTLITKVLVKENDPKIPYTETIQQVEPTKINSENNQITLNPTNCQDSKRACDFTESNITEVTLEVEDFSKKIIVYTDSLKNRHYISIEKYNSVKDELQYETLNVIDCVEGVRLPNRTNCKKYYNCYLTPEPVVKDFICPTFLAFNEETRKCDKKSYSPCRKKLNDDRRLDTSSDSARSLTNPCKLERKVADLNFKSHYFHCKENPANSELMFVRKVCPRGLIFCERSQVCTVEQSC